MSVVSKFIKILSSSAFVNISHIAFFDIVQPYLPQVCVFLFSDILCLFRLSVLSLYIHRRFANLSHVLTTSARDMTQLSSVFLQKRQNGTTHCQETDFLKYFDVF